MPLKFADLDQKTRQLAWSQALPDSFKYYHRQEEGDQLITIDDQESFQNAIRHNIEKLDSLIMRLYVAQSAEEALQVLHSRERLIQKLSVVDDPRNNSTITDSQTISSF